jgi:hypothetical protein
MGENILDPPPPHRWIGWGGVVENHGDGGWIAASIDVGVLWQKSRFRPLGAMEAGVV